MQGQILSACRRENKKNVRAKPRKARRNRSDCLGAKRCFWRKFENADSCGLYKSGGAEFPDNELWGSSRIRDAQKARL